ncbi:ThiF family adenylyltransferase [Vibrio ostreicida]|uniref:ThiF family adenylyltransferase n=1 Tax=Vibrio ostreicida TaxID=526588 RepID=UPI003B5AE311
MSAVQDWINYDIRQLSLHDDVTNLVAEITDDKVHVSFDLSFIQYAQVLDLRIRFPEKITLVYLNKLERNAPEILATRESFPHNLPHLNPVKKEEPASLCLWRKGGTDTLYKQKGILETIKILQGWLEDASLGRLNKDGWEPSPRTSLVSFHMDVPKLQEMVANPKNENSVYVAESACFFFKLSQENIVGISRGFKILNRKVINSDSLPKKQDRLAQPVDLEKKELITLKVVLSIPPIDRIDSYHTPHKINTFEDLKGYSDYESLQKTLSAIEKEFDESKDEQGVIVLIAHRRPLPLIEEIMGLAENEEHRKVELLPFFIHKTKSNISVQFLSLRSEITDKELGDISGYAPVEGNIGIIGCGSLGSTIADQIARLGHSNITLWDIDCLEAHNTARHVSVHSTFDVPLLITKANLVGEHIKSMSTTHKKCVTVESHNFSLNQDHKTVQQALHIIDATASDLEKYWQSAPNCPVSRVYISDEGRVGIIQTQPQSGIPDMLDLDAFLLLLSKNDSDIQNWLSRQSTLSSKLVGLSCSSETLELPWSSILNHASSMVPALKQQFSTPSPLIGINILDKNGFPKGYKEVGNEKNLNFLSKTVKDNEGIEWKISIHQSVINKIDLTLEKHSPREAGGYLLGLFSLETHRVSIVFASEGKFKSSPSYLELEAIENDPEIGAIEQSSHSMLVPLGTWHSHPNSSDNESDRDVSTYHNIIKDPEQVLPFVMLIRGKDDVNLLIGLNRTT